MITSQSTLQNSTKPASPPNRTNSANIVIVRNVAEKDSAKSREAIRREFANDHPRVKLNQDGSSLMVWQHSQHSKLEFEMFR